MRIETRHTSSFFELSLPSARRCSKARAEWEALQHALDFAPDLQQDLFHGMLSGGGMSCQLARYLDMESVC